MENALQLNSKFKKFAKKDEEAQFSWERKTENDKIYRAEDEINTWNKILGGY